MSLIQEPTEPIAIRLPTHARTSLTRPSPDRPCLTDLVCRWEKNILVPELQEIFISFKPRKSLSNSEHKELYFSTRTNLCFVSLSLRLAANLSIDISHSSCLQGTYAEYYIRVHRHRHRTYRFVLCCLRTPWFVPSRKPWKGCVQPHNDSL
jgi:hypothetical protein